MNSVGNILASFLVNQLPLHRTEKLHTFAAQDRERCIIYNAFGYDDGNVSL